MNQQDKPNQDHAQQSGLPSISLPRIVKKQTSTCNRKKAQLIPIKSKKSIHELTKITNVLTTQNIKMKNTYYYNTSKCHFVCASRNQLSQYSTNIYQISETTSSQPYIYSVINEMKEKTSRSEARVKRRIWQADSKISTETQEETVCTW